MSKNNSRRKKGRDLLGSQGLFIRRCCHDLSRLVGRPEPVRDLLPIPYLRGRHIRQLTEKCTSTQKHDLVAFVLGFEELLETFEMGFRGSSTQAVSFVNHGNAVIVREIEEVHHSMPVTLVDAYLARRAFPAFVPDVLNTPSHGVEEILV